MQSILAAFKLSVLKSSRCTLCRAPYQLRSNPSTQQTHAVIVTAMSEIEIRAYNSKAGELGVDAFMSKPIKAEAVRTLASKLKP